MPKIFDADDKEAQKLFLDAYHGAFQSIGELLNAMVLSGKDDAEKMRIGCAVAAACVIIKELTLLKASPAMKADFEAGVKLLHQKTLAEMGVKGTDA